MRNRRTRVGVLVAAAMAIVAALAISSIGEATHTPANKVWVAGDTIEWMEKSVAEDAPAENPDQVVLAVGRAKFSNPTDIRLSVQSECALWTNTATTGDDDSESKARVEVWVTIDDNVVPVSSNDTGTGESNDPDDQASRGRVVFCNRAARMKTEQIESNPPSDPVPPTDPTCTEPTAIGEVTTVDEKCVDPNDDPDTEDDILLRSYNRSRSANGFNWGALNVGEAYDEPGIPAGAGENVVEIKVHARLAASIDDDDDSDNNKVDSPAALAAIGKRTLFVEPVKMANDAAF